MDDTLSFASDQECRKLADSICNTKLIITQKNRSKKLCLLGLSSIPLIITIPTAFRECKTYYTLRNKQARYNTNWFNHYKKCVDNKPKIKQKSFKTLY